MTTKAIYHPAEKLRAINISGKWQLQRHDGSVGTREHDPWYAIGGKKDEPPNWKGTAS
jgi:hypothetical protein